MENTDVEKYMEGRMNAARRIDVETCKMIRIHGNACDPYGIYRDPDMDHGRLLFVVSPDSDGWVYAGDLPTDKYLALQERIDRITRIPITAEIVCNMLLEEYDFASGEKALDEVIEDVARDRFQQFRSILLAGVGLMLTNLGRKDTLFAEQIERHLRDMDYNARSEHKQ